MLALEDAKRCVLLAPDWAKGYYRLGKALLALGRIQVRSEDLSLLALTRPAALISLTQLTPSVRTSHHLTGGQGGADQRPREGEASWQRNLYPRSA